MKILNVLLIISLLMIQDACHEHHENNLGGCQLVKLSTTNVTETYEYNSAGKVSDIHYKYSKNDKTFTADTKLEYDGSNRLVKIISEEAVTTLEYSADGKTIIETRDAIPNPDLISDRKTFYYLNSKGLVEKVQNDSSDGYSRYEYDEKNRILKLFQRDSPQQTETLIEKFLAYDDKKNPYAKLNIATISEIDDGPIGVTRVSFTTFYFPFSSENNPLKSVTYYNSDSTVQVPTYKYNEFGYPTVITTEGFGQTNLTYACK
jgi:YD repeat-containing protein